MAHREVLLICMQCRFLEMIMQNEACTSTDLFIFLSDTVSDHILECLQTFGLDYIVNN